MTQQHTTMERTKPGIVEIGDEDSSILRLTENGKEVTYEANEFEVEFSDNGRDSEDTQCKLTEVTITIKKKNKEGKLCKEKRDYDIEEVWFKNRKLFVELLSLNAYMPSAWCRLHGRAGVHAVQGAQPSC